jgi:hypothetical protein
MDIFSIAREFSRSNHAIGQYAKQVPSIEGTLLPKLEGVAKAYGGITGGGAAIGILKNLPKYPFPTIATMPSIPSITALKVLIGGYTIGWCVMPPPRQPIVVDVAIDLEFSKDR